MMPRQMRPNTWELDSPNGHYHYTIWTPTKTHPVFQAAWHSADGVLHDQKSGRTLAKVLALFPSHVAKKFATVINDDERNTDETP